MCKSPPRVEKCRGALRLVRIHRSPYCLFLSLFCTVPDLGLNVLDRTVQDTNRWLRAIARQLGDEEAKQPAYHALRAVLFALRDRTGTDLAADFSAGLPLLVRGIFYEGYRPADQPKDYRTMDAWNEEVDRELRQTPGDAPAPEEATRAVFTVLSKELDWGTVRKTFSTLPEDVRVLWPGVPEQAAKD